METRPESEFVTWLSATARGLGYANDRQLALAINVRPSTISRWRRENLRPSVAHLLRISKVFGINIVPLLALSGHVPPEAVADAEVPEPPSPVTETVRRIRDAPLDDSLKAALLKYWDKRLDEERGRLYAMIDLIQKWGDTGEIEDEETSLANAFQLLDTDLPTHVKDAFIELGNAAEQLTEEHRSAGARQRRRRGRSA